MAIGEIVIKLELDDKNFKGTISGAEGDLRRFERAVKSSDKVIRASERGHKTWARTLRDSVIVLGLARHAIANLSSVLFSLPVAVIRANAELERMEALMQGLSAEAGGFAQAQADARKNMEFLFDAAKRGPFEVGALTDAFVKMKAVGIDPLGGLFQGLVDSVAKFGGSSEQLKRASIAIQQMAGKGVISMEELRQQLGEAVPDAIQIMARSMGVSMGELVKSVSSGTVEAKNALAAMARQMSIENSGAALRMSQTWDGMMNRMKTSITLTAKQIGDAGFFEAVKSQLSFLVDDTLQDPRFFQFMRDLGSFMNTALSATASFIGKLYEFRGAIIDVTQGLAALWVVSKSGKIWEFMSRGIDGAKAALASTKTQLVSVSTELARARTQVEHYNRVTKVITATVAEKSVAMAQLRVVTNRAAMAFRTFFAAIGGWTTVALVGIPVLIAMFDRLQDKSVETAREINRNAPEMITKEQISALDEVIIKYKSLQGEIAGVQAQIDRAKEMEKEGTVSENPRRVFERRLEILMEELKSLEEALGGSLDTAFETKRLAEEAALQRSLDAITRMAELDAERQLRESVLSYKRDMQALIEGKKDLGEEAFKEARIAREQQFLAETNKFWQERIAAETAAREKMIASGKALDDVEVAQQQAHIDALIAAQEKSAKRFDGTVYEIKSIDQEDANKKLTALEQFLVSRQKMLSKYKAKADDENPFLAEFEAMVELGSFGEATKQQLEEARKVMAELWKARKAWDAQNAETQAFGDSLERINQLSGSIDTKFQQRANNNPLMRDAIEAEKLRAKLEEVGAEISSMTLVDQEARTKALEDIQRLGIQVEANARAATVAQIKSATEAMNREMLPEMEQVAAKYDDLIAKAWEWRRANGELSTEELEAFGAYLDTLNKKMAEEMRSPLDELMIQWGDGTAQMQNLWTNTMTSFVDTLTDGLMEGKLQLADFVEEFARMIIKMQLQKAAAGIVSGLGGMFGGPQNVGSVAGSAGYSTSGYAGAYGFANGGIMTPRGALALETYSNGGIANKPQIALFGEGRQNEAYVPLPDGRTIPVTLKGAAGSGSNGMGPVTVNVLNQSGQSVDAEAGSPRFDGEQYVLDIVLHAAGRPGGFRNGLKTALGK